MRYLFKHVLMRDVVYNMQLHRQLRRMHLAAAQALETSHADDLTPHYADLAHHYRQADMVEPERHYARLAGEQAAKQFANAEALDHLNRALALTPQDNLEERFDLRLSREEIYGIQGDRRAQEQDIAILRSLAERLDDDQKRAQALLRQANYASKVADYPAAIAAAQQAQTLAVQDAEIKVSIHQRWGVALWRQGRYEAARTQLEQSLTLAQTTQQEQAQANSLTISGHTFLEQGNHQWARSNYEQSLQICHKIGDQRGESGAMNDLANVFLDQGDYIRARAYYERALLASRQVGDRFFEGVVLFNLGLVSVHLGEYDRAHSYYERALQISNEIDDRRGKVETLEYIGLLYHYQGNDELAHQYIQKTLALARQLGDRYNEGFCLTFLGHALAGLGQLEEAIDVYQQALDVRRELGQLSLEMEVVAGLARASLAKGEPAQAQAYAERIMNHLKDNTLDGTEEPFRIYLTCYQVLQANHDPRAQDLLTTAHNLLRERAARIADETTRRSFLENVVAHREIAAEGQRITGNPAL